MRIKKLSLPGRGLTIIEVLLVVFIGCLLLTVFYGSMVSQPRHHAPRIGCVNNLKQIGIAFRIWAEDHRDCYPMEVSTNEGGSKEFNATPQVYRIFQVMQNEMGQSPKITLCPADTERRSATNFVNFGNSNVSYFADVSVAWSNSSSMFLNGDRNLSDPWGPLRSVTDITSNSEISWGLGLHSAQNHPGAGNILLNDGSAQQVSTPALQKNWLPGAWPATFVIP